MNSSRGEILPFVYNFAMVDLFSRLESALSSPQPRAKLSTLMAEMLEQGLERDEIFGTLEHFRARLAADQRVEEEQLILEMIDGFTGWCRLD